MTRTARARLVALVRRSPRFVRLLREAIRLPRRIRWFGLALRCPVCGARARRFLPHGPKAAPDIECPVCGTHPRHRFSWPYLVASTNLADGRPKRVLHFAPERELSERMRVIPGVDYVSTDLRPGRAMVQADICNLHFADASFDVVLCSHVLEHIPDDRKAMRELCRVTRPGGWALVQVPLSPRPTDEDPAVTDPKERERRFLQDDHVRWYGPDIEGRLREAGFDVTRVRAADRISPDELRRSAIGGNETLFICSKPQSARPSA